MAEFFPEKGVCWNDHVSKVAPIEKLHIYLVSLAVWSTVPYLSNHEGQVVTPSLRLQYAWKHHSPVEKFSEYMLT